MNFPENQFSRRAFLRGSGALIALPFLESLAKPLTAATVSAKSTDAMRMVCIGLNYGMHPTGFFPKQTGRDYELPYLLKPLKGLQNDFSLFSHLDHPGIKGGHQAVHTYLSGVRADMAKGMPEGNISMDQKAAEFVGSRTRYPSMQLNVGGGDNGISWTRNGVSVPSMDNLQTVFDAMFQETNKAHKRRLARSYKLNSSILDLVQEDAQDLKRRLSANDLDKLDEYFTSVRDVEKRLQMSEAWLNKPKPKVDYKLPNPMPDTFYDEVPLYYDLIKLALVTDSTRIISYAINGWSGDSGLPGVTKGYHALTHHGMDQSRLKELTIIETFHAREFARFITDLKNTQMENDNSLLDKTMVLFGSGMGNASSHSNRDLPLILAGGGFTHGEHKDYPKVGDKQTPACNLYVSMLQKFGMEVDSFGTSTGTLEGLS